MNFDECLEYVKTALRRVDNKSYVSRNNSTYLERDFLFYGWLLQREFDKVDKKLLTNYVGVDRSERIDDAAELLDEKAFDVYMDESFRFIDPMMDAIEAAFDSDEFEYRILQDLPFFPKKYKAIDFIKHMNQMETPNQPLEQLIPNALISALDGVKKKAESVNSGITILEGPTGTQDKIWLLGVSVMPYHCTLSERDEKSFDFFLSRFIAQNEAIGDFRQSCWYVLTFCTSVDGNVRKFVEGNRDIYYMWDLSAVRFFNKLKTTIENIPNTDAKAKSRKTAEHFMNCFARNERDKNVTRTFSYSSKQAIELLQASMGFF